MVVADHGACGFGPLLFGQIQHYSRPGRGGGGGGETKSGTEKRCSHNLQSGHSAWWSADNYILLQEIFLDFLEARSEPAEEIRNA